MLNVARSFLMVLTVLVVASYSSIPTVIEICDLGSCSDELAQLSHDDQDASSTDHSPLSCQCANHSCSHTSVVMSRGVLAATAADLSDVGFLDHYDFHLLSPYIDGPFQPPKA